MQTGDMKTRPDGDEPRVPRKLIAALEEPPSRRVFVSPIVDDAILAAARRHLAPPRPRRASLRSWLLWPALATACVAITGAVYLAVRSAETRNIADVNRDGTVDILDAFQLARTLEARSRPAPESDLNHDGTVDQRDVALIAAEAVKLQKGGGS
jgi:hypothetical protein